MARKEIKPIGHNIDLKALVIHQVIKGAGDRHTTVKDAKGLIHLAEKDTKFIGQLYTSYNQKSNPIYGIFGNEDATFKNYLKAYLVEDDFYKFSIDAIRHYKLIISTSAPATGGFFIFAHFTNTDNKNSYILVLTINNKDGYMVSEADLTIKDIKNLDLNKVDIACLINITKWERIEKGKDKDSKTYLSFIKGKKDVSVYFMSFIDCDDKTTSSESTKGLVKAINSYCEEMGYDRNQKIKKREQIFDYCDDCIKEKKEISLLAISALFDNERPYDFMNFANSEEYGVNSTISGDKSQLRRLKYTSYKDDNITIVFDNNMLGKSIIYDENKKQLVFKKLPDALINELEK